MIMTHWAVYCAQSTSSRLRKNWSKPDCQNCHPVSKLSLALHLTRKDTNDKTIYYAKRSDQGTNGEHFPDY